MAQLSAASRAPALVVCLQATAILDHVCRADEHTVNGIIVNGETSGSQRVSQEALQELIGLAHDAVEVLARPGGSAANVARTLAGLGVASKLVGGYGADSMGQDFLRCMCEAGVHVEDMVQQPGSTGHTLVLTGIETGQRTMRTFTDQMTLLSPEQVVPCMYRGATWAFLSAYAVYAPGLLQGAARAAREAGAQVALDLASWEVVRAHRAELLELLGQGLVDVCVCNEDEAKQLVGLRVTDGRGPHAAVEAALQLLSQRCSLAVVTVGKEGCFARERGQSGPPLREPAAAGVSVLDTTGAGDAFTAGLLSGLARGLPTQHCLQVACTCGGAAVQALGSELPSESWEWLRARLGHP